MELRQLRYFVVVAEELHFARAAARLMIAGPSLSQQVKALERDLGVVLLDRSSTGVSLTTAGRELLPLARAALAAADDVRDVAQRIRDDRATLLRLGFLAFALGSTTRRLLTEYGRTATTVTVQMRQYEWDDPSAGLLSGETDVAFVRPPFTGSERLHLLELAADPVLAVVGHEHRLADEASVSTADLGRETFVEADVVTDPVFADYWYLRPRQGDARAARTHAATVDEWLAEIAFGRGVNLIPASLAEEYRRPGLAFVPVSDAPPSTLALAWRRDDARPVVSDFARFAARARRRSAGRGAS